MDFNLRKFENYHIVLWLVKDLCWALVWRPLGVAMVIPTVGLAFYIAWKSFGDKFDFFHNVAICAWICANAIWMTGEFYDRETRPVAVILFCTGLAIIFYAYIHRRQANKKAA